MVQSVIHSYIQHTSPQVFNNSKKKNRAAIIFGRNICRFINLDLIKVLTEQGAQGWKIP